MGSKEFNFINISKNDLSSRESFRDSVYGLLKDSYAGIGGVEAINGFSSAVDMDMNTDLWILLVNSESIVLRCVVLKLKELDNVLYRKAVAYGSVRPVSLDDAIHIRAFKEHFHIWMIENAFMEISGNFMFSFFKNVSRNLDILRYVIHPKIAIPNKDIIMFDESKKDMLNVNDLITYAKLKIEYPELLKYIYIRSIGGSPKLKIILGTLKRL